MNRKSLVLLPLLALLVACNIRESSERKPEAIRKSSRDAILAIRDTAKKIDNFDSFYIRFKSDVKLQKASTARVVKYTFEEDDGGPSGPQTKTTKILGKKLYYPLVEKAAKRFNHASDTGNHGGEHFWDIDTQKSTATKKVISDYTAETDDFRSCTFEFNGHWMLTEYSTGL